MVEAIAWIVALVGIVWVFALVVSGSRSAHRPRVGSGATGAIYDMLNEDKRNAIEIIVEGRAEARDPEDKDGNLPDLSGTPSPSDSSHPAHPAHLTHPTHDE